MKLFKIAKAATIIHALAVGALGIAALMPITELAAAETASKLGDLSPFRAIVVDTKSMVDKSDLVAAKTRIKDLETTWDEAEPSLKPRSAAHWHLVDKAIDRALDALRAPKPDSSLCKQSLTDLLSLLDASAK